MLRDFFGCNFGRPIRSKKSIDLLLHIRQLSITIAAYAHFLHRFDESAKAFQKFLVALYAVSIPPARPLVSNIGSPL